MKLVHRFLLREFLGQFLICAAGISIFMIGFVLYKEAATLIGFKVPFRLIVWLLLNRWPLVLLDVMPGAGMFAVLLSLGRMVRERELTVFRVSGWSFPRLIWPLLALTLVLSYAVFLWNDRVVPASEHRYNVAWDKLTRQQVYNFVVTKRFVTGPDNTRFYIGSIDRRSGEMRDVMVFQENPGGYPRFITAATGRVDGQIWTLRQGVVHELGRDGYVTIETGFSRMTVNTKQNWAFLFENPGRQNELTRAELRQRAIEQDRMARPAGGVFPGDSLWLNYHLKMSAPFALFVFTTLAIPFACLGSRSGRLAIFLPALLLYLGYFLVLTVLVSLGTQGAIAPWLAAWGSNMLFGGLSVILLLVLVK